MKLPERNQTTDKWRNDSICCSIHHFETCP